MICLKCLKLNKNLFKKIHLAKQCTTTIFFKKIMAIGLGLSFVFGNIGYNLLGENKAYAYENSYFSSDAYASHWGRSDVRAHLNGLTKVNNNLPIDGSNGTKSAGNFLNYFTNAELSLFQPKWITTTMYNDRSQTEAISEIKTKDKFWLPSGNYNGDQLLSADPSYDLSDNNTYTQKVNNGKVNNWKNIIPTPMWIVGTNCSCLRSSLHTKYYKENVLLSARFVKPSANYYYVFNGDITINDYYTCACAYMSFPSNFFTATASASANQIGQNFSNLEISAYDNLGKKDYVGAPSWGMHLKQISLSSINGTLNYNNGQNSLTFTANSEIPKDKYLMVQAYKAWDSTKTPTENAGQGDTVYVAGKKIENDSTTSVTFENAPDLSEHTVKVWVEEKETENSLAQASSPLTFLVNGTSTLSSVTETKSTNPRVFANKDDLSCSWGTYENETDSTILEEGKSGFYVGENATWQKLCIGTGTDNKPIEWWIAGSDNGGLTLYQATGNTGNHQFNSSNDIYTGSKRNPSLSLAGEVTSEDLENISSKVTLKANKNSQEPLNASADTFSVQYCKATKNDQNQFLMSGFEWTDSPTGNGDYYIRAVFSGETIDGVNYAPCISAKQLVKGIVFEYVSNVNIRNGENEITSETITLDGVLPLNAIVNPSNVYNTKVKWSVTSGDDKIKLYQDENCNTELSPSDEIESGATVYVKSLGNVGQATITVTSAGLDAAEGEPKTKNCNITIINNAPNEFVATINKDSFTYNGHSQVPKVTVKDRETLLTEGTDYELSYKRIAKDRSADTEKSKIIDAGRYKVIINGLGDYYNKKLEKEFTIKTDKSSWGKQIVNNGKENYVTNTGMTSAEVLNDNSDENGIICLKEESDGSSAWYGIDNSKGVFRQGSRFWVRWLTQEDNKEEFEKYYSQLDDSHKRSVADGKLWLFLVGVTDPDGNEYTEFAYDVDLYIELGEDWNKDDINVVFISPQNDEVLNVTYVDNFKCPEGNRTFAKVRLHHFSPYAIYEKDNPVTLHNDDIDDSSGQLSNTSNPNTSDNISSSLTAFSILFVGAILIFFLTYKKSSSKEPI